MKLNPEEASQLSALTLAFHEGSLTPDEAARLESLVLRDPQACREFVQRSAIVADLHWQFSATQADDLQDRQSSGELEEQPPTQTAERAGVPIAPPAAVASPGEPLSGMGGGEPAWSFAGLFGGARQHPLLYFAAAIVLAYTLWSATSHWLGQRDQPRAMADAAQFDLDKAVARLTRTLDAQWGVGEINEGAFLRNNQRLELVAGLAEITYKNGAVVLLEAPVSYLLSDRNLDAPATGKRHPCNGYLETGRISVRVPPAAHGFSLQTPAATITDMGAEFGVAVDPNEAVSLVVFTGAAEIRIGEKFGDWRQRVEAGGALRFDPSELTPIPQTVEEAGPFVRKLPEELPQLMLHWDFDAVADDGKLVLDRSGQGRHGRFVGDAGRVHLAGGPEGFGSAIALNGFEELVELAEPQWSRLDDSFEEFTVALWVNPAELPDAELMLCGKMGWISRRGWQLSILADGRPRLVFFRAASDNEPIELVGEKPLPVGKFSHLAMTFKGRDSARLYIDGEATATLADVPMRINGANQVNLQIGNRGDGIKGRFFEGLIDDLRVYRVALSGTMIRRIMHLEAPRQHSSHVQQNEEQADPAGR